MSERRLILFHDPDEAARWQEALDAAGLPAQCVAYEEPFKDERGFWQPPRWKSHDFTCRGVTKHFYYIDGGWYRANIDNNFDGGGNHGAYPGIPPDCEYLEANNDESQWDSLIIGEHHEAPEDVEMAGDWQANYEEAHGHAITEERSAREPYRDPRVIADPSKPEESNDAQVDSPAFARVDPLAVARATMRIRR